ncbi:MAG: flagellin [bacterium]
MGLFVNSNIASLNAQRNLTKATGSLGRSFERLSSGLRINSAKDDAAGLAIASRFTSQIRGLNQAVRNTNDGISLSQTAEGALQESGNIVQRIRELSVQAANDTNTQSDRESLQAEVDQLISELDRIAETTTFNSSKILDGSFQGAKFHVGANARETITVTVSDARASSLGRQVRETSLTAIDVDDAAGAALAANELFVNGVTIRATVDADDTVSTTLNSASAIAKAAAINDSTAFTGVRAIVEETTVTGGAITAGTLDSANNVTINGEAITGIDIELNDANDTLVSAINAVSDRTGVVASLNEANQLQLTAADGRNIEVEVAGNGAALTGLAAGVTGGRITLQSEQQVRLENSAGVAVGAAVLSKLGDVGAIDADNDGAADAPATLFGVNSKAAISTVDITTREGANRAIEIADVAIGQIASTRAQLGAVQNRLESTVSNLSATSQNLSAARSRIEDADFAEESAIFSRNQILQQAGISVLAQANQQPQVALSLLG